MEPEEPYFFPTDYLYHGLLSGHSDKVVFLQVTTAALNGI